MKPLAVVGPDAGTLVDWLADRLTERGVVGTVGHLDETDVSSTDPHRNASVTRSYAIAADGWRATGDALSLDDALDSLARSCDYALVEGFERARLPTVVLGDETVDSGWVIARADSPDDVDVADLAAEIETVDPYETLSSLVARVKESAAEPFAGAIATFTGRVRAREDADDDPTEYLEFERYDGVAGEKMATIREELESRDGVYEVLLHHRTGVVEAGEDIVFVVVLAGHRPEAFATVEDGIDRLKEDVPLFKKEVTVSDEFWAHEH